MNSFIEMNKAPKKQRKQKGIAAYIETDDLNNLFFELYSYHQKIAKLQYLTASRPIEIVTLRKPSKDAVEISISMPKTDTVKHLEITEEIQTVLDSIDCRAGDLLFPSPTGSGKPVTYMSYYKEVKRAANILGLPDNVTPHSFRRTACTDIYKDARLEQHDEPYKTVAAISGHQSIDSLMDYLAIEKKRAKRNGQKSLGKRVRL